MSERFLSRVSRAVRACGGRWFAACVGDDPATPASGTANDASVSGDTMVDDTSTGRYAGGNDAAKTTRNLGALFTNILALAELNTTGNDPYARLYRAVAGGVWTNIKGVNGTNRGFSENGSSFDSDPFQLVYASTLTTNGATYDLYRSTPRVALAGEHVRHAHPRHRARLGHHRHPSRHLGGRANDEPSWISPDGCRLYFSSRPGTVSADIWVAERLL